MFRRFPVNRMPTRPARNDQIDCLVRKPGVKRASRARRGDACESLVPPCVRASAVLVVSHQNVSRPFPLLLRRARDLGWWPVMVRGLHDYN